MVIIMIMLLIIMIMIMMIIIIIIIIINILTLKFRMQIFQTIYFKEGYVLHSIQISIQNVGFTLAIK
jgi:hypothetical protein